MTQIPQKKLFIARKIQFNILPARKDRQKRRKIHFDKHPKAIIFNNLPPTSHLLLNLNLNQLLATFFAFKLNCHYWGQKNLWRWILNGYLRFVWMFIGWHTWLALLWEWTGAQKNCLMKLRVLIAFGYVLNMLICVDCLKNYHFY